MLHNSEQSRHRCCSERPVLLLHDRDIDAASSSICVLLLEGCMCAKGGRWRPWAMSFQSALQNSHFSRGLQVQRVL